MAADLILFAKYPVPGFAKTRLIPALGEAGAAALHRRLTERTVATMLAAAAMYGARMEVQYTGADEADFRAWLGGEVALVPQPEGDLTDRLIAASRETPHIFLGADTPDLTAEIVGQAIAALDTHEVVIGPAEDGGYYLIGMRQARPGLLTDMPWSTEQVFPETMRRLGAAGIEPALLPTLADCDRPEDLARWPGLAGEMAGS